jgi:hypothetical protein
MLADGVYLVPGAVEVGELIAAEEELPWKKMPPVGVLTAPMGEAPVNAEPEPDITEIGTVVPVGKASNEVAAGRVRQRLGKG